MRTFLSSLAGIGLIAVAMSASAQDAKRSLTQVTDDIWRFDNNFHASFVVVTPEGAIVGDPINEGAASWLKSEISQRFGVPVTHMVMSHSHADHASGGQVFEDATVYAHENFQSALDAGKVSTATPDVTFSDRHTFSVGEKTFELTYLGPGHGDDTIATVIRPDNVAVVVDVVSPRRLPYRTISTSSLDRLLDQIRTVESLDFDILLPGHSVNGVRQDATDMRVYLETLRERVKAQLDAGNSSDDIIASLEMPEYKHWGAYDTWLRLNVEGMIRLVGE